MRKVWLLGATGSIGTQALDVIRRNPESFLVAGLGAGGGRVELLVQQAQEFHVPVVAIARPQAVEEFRALWAHSAAGAPEPEILSGADALADLAALAEGDGKKDGSQLNSAAAECATSIVSANAPASSAKAAVGAKSTVFSPVQPTAQVGHDSPESTLDVVLNGVSGSVGLAPTLAALKTGATLALANKESLVAGGALVQNAMVRPGQIVPVDSEHSAIFQALQSGTHHRGLTSADLDGESNVRRIILTASGGPFRGRSRADLAGVTVQEALNHPTWNMGPVVTINSATLMNKGLELIEAAYLFDLAPEQIVPVVHPQSVVHSMVEFIDGSTVAQLSPPDMRLPIALGLSWPQRIPAVAPAYSWEQAASWSFEPLDNEVFPAVQLAREALTAGPLFPAVLNAANEQAVEAFTRGELSFLGITAVVKHTLESFSEHIGEQLTDVLYTLEVVKKTELWARACADALIRSL
ncbi:MAG: 1-deoxy-D-xylulose-5-phosphate reductoisomerase [Arcanobacterium sp.]|nr:1-deoxy-D-xylulose-5-phosphate reductoisomerase [Arcanobacterium sp.]MDY5589706.1 1-deoxy-D-xylulose-5-phosphate reductoisomerase [Arcanobacterium sp.]